MGLIWISQILRIIEIEYAITGQIFEIAIATIFALPSFINPLIPFLILVASFSLNNKLNSYNEIIIIKQYLSRRSVLGLYLTSIVIIFSIFLLNNELVSKNFYAKYKIKELEIRNNLKLGSPSNNEFHIDQIISIFFEEKKDGTFFDIQAIIYPENQFISAELVQIELSKSNFNLVFEKGERLILNDKEKSKTLFNKFTYPITNKQYEILLMDKEHYNTFELLKHKTKDFKFHGHNNIFQYFFLLFVSIISINIIFLHQNKKSYIKNLSLIFFIILIIQIINSYLQYLLNNSAFFNIKYYYITLIFLISGAYLFIRKLSGDFI